MPKKKPFRSVVTQIMVYPILIYIVIILSVVFLSISSLFSLQGQMVNNTMKSLQISMNQINNLISQVDYEYANWWTNSKAHLFLKAYTPETPLSERMPHQMETYTWVQNLVNNYQEVVGAFSYYSNIDLLVFRGGANTIPVQNYVREELGKADREHNRWEVIEVSGQEYLFTMKKYGVYQGGAWIPTYRIASYLNAQELEDLGIVYIVDSMGNSNLPEGEIQEMLQQSGWANTKLRIEGKMYNNYIIGDEQGLRMGILVDSGDLFLDILRSNWHVLLLSLIAIGIAPVCILWLRSKIARPVRDIDMALHTLGTKELGYHIPVRHHKYDNEFDRLVGRFNETMDRLTEAEHSLYETRIKEQRTKLMYVSQQIRPHFILNALNIIYTYEEHEFPLVKKLVLYLTQYFRYVVNLNQDFVELSKETRHIQNYLNIQKERYGDRFDFFVEYEPEVEDALVPPLIIQTFVENCIKYGMRNEDKTYIYVLASRKEDRLHLMIADTGNGFSEEKLEQVQRFLDSGEGGEHIGVGIQNAVERMDILYHGKVEVKVRNAQFQGAVVDIYLPILENREGRYEV